MTKKSSNKLSGELVVSDKFNKTTTRILRERVGNRCSKCKRITSGPNMNPNKSTILGEAAHITAASSKGPRRDHSITSVQRKHILNGIWLCPNCATLIDKNPDRYSIEYLKNLKKEAEDVIAKELEENQGLNFYNPKDIRCTKCKKFVDHEADVCIWCKANIVRNSTKDERIQDINNGMLGGVLFLSIWYPAFFHRLINILFDMKVKFELGVTVVGIVIILTMIFVFSCGYLWAKKQNQNRKSQIRFIL
jgi:hypothetical protein